MTDIPESEIEVVEEATPPPRRRSLLGRIGCGFALFVWAVLIMSPCIIGIFVTRGEITVDVGSAPGQQVRIWLVMEVDERGIGLSSPSVYAGEDDNSLCVQTNVRYYLWVGRAEPISYCECYSRSAPISAWEATASTQGECAAP